MLQSAVVLPDDPPTQSPPTLKRRQSSISSESNKRPRIDSSHASPPPPVAMSPPPQRRQSSTTSSIEERKRSQRLFGALLGTLSAPSSKPQHRRRDEIEQRQREKLRASAEEDAEANRKRRAELEEVRRKEQELWEEQGMRVRHANERARANFLVTKTEPTLYYKPWELTSEDEERIKRQIDEVEDGIRKELAKVAATKGEETGMNEGIHLPTNPEEATGGKSDGTEKEPDQTAGKVSLNGDDKGESHDENKDNDPQPENVTPGDHDKPTNGPQTKPLDSTRQDKPPEDHSHEELVEGHAGEDDVIY